MAPYLPGDHLNGQVMKVGYSVDDGKDCGTSFLDPGLPLLQHADLKDKVVLLRVDHNVVKKGEYYSSSEQHYVIPIIIVKGESLLSFFSVSKSSQNHDEW